ncbi:MAG: hypothetical protein AB7F39_04910 [Variibacter sp.]
MRLAKELVSGHWLGAFNQFTLMKGPGYPAFLALAAASGLPVSAAHAFVHCLAILTTAWALRRITGSTALALVALLILIFLPASFDPQLQRVFRDQIYWSQTLLVLSTFSVALLAPPVDLRRRMLFALLSGVLLEWTWLTREEGIWLVPGLGIIVLGRALQLWRERGSFRNAAAMIGCVLGGFMCVQASFFTMNYLRYGALVGVDTKETNFMNAFAALQSIDTGDRRPYVPVSEATLEAAAAHSATFAPVANSLRKGGPLDGWYKAGCETMPQTCGSIGGGWFIWAFRDAAALNGFFESPSVASTKFGAMAAEITDACRNGKLHCRRAIQSFIPPLTSEQWWQLPGRMLGAIRIASLVDISVAQAQQPRKEEDIATLNRYWLFLNFPKIVGPQEGAERQSGGWFYDPNSDEWPDLQVSGQNGQRVLALVTRVPGPDVARAFGDPKAEHSRFRISYICLDECSLDLGFADGGRMSVPLTLGESKSATVGTRMVRIDMTSAQEHPATMPDARVRLALQITNALYRIYKIGFPLLLLLGAGFYVASMLRAIVNRHLEGVLVVATSAWILLLARNGIFALADVASFPALNITYLVPATYVAGIAAILSIYSMFKTLRHAKVGEATADAESGYSRPLGDLEGSGCSSSQEAVP